MTIKKRRRAPTTPLERANRENDDDFISHYLAPGPTASPWVTTWTHPHTTNPYTLTLISSQHLPKPDFEACFSLIEETSRADYEASTTKWHPARKRKEMRSPDLRYILVKDDTAAVRAFTSLMPVYEDGQPVIYCYEIHLKPELQRTGLGSLLLGFLEIVGWNLRPVEKVMLTCYKSNEGAGRFYRKLGFVVDEISPGVRTLRGGKVFVPDYEILSKMVRSTTGDDEVAKGDGTT